MKISRQEYRSGISFHPPRDLPNAGIEPVSPVSTASTGGFFITVPPEKPFFFFFFNQFPFTGRTDAEGETPILWPPDAKN